MRSVFQQPKGLSFILAALCAFAPLAESESLISKCRRAFVRASNPIEYSLLYKNEWASPLAKEIYFFVYQRLPLLEGSSLSSADIKKYVFEFEALLNDLESSANDQSLSRRFRLMAPSLSPAIKAFPAIASFIKAGKASGYSKSLDLNLIAQLVLSSLGRHSKAYLKHPNFEKLDWPRRNLILSAIADFDQKPNVFSLYKIQRAVKRKYSLDEYINCK